MKHVDWTSIGNEYNATDAQKARILEDHKTMEWLNTKDKPSLSMAGGLAIQEAIKTLHLLAVAVADYSPEGHLGIRAKYADGLKDILFEDEGTSIVPIAIIHGA